ncbi:hypothetical protein GCM10010524_67550 [Streptomyces mexicanus]
MSPGTRLQGAVTTLAARPVGVRVAWVTLVGSFNKPLACREIINGREEAA